MWQIVPQGFLPAAKRRGRLRAGRSSVDAIVYVKRSSATYSAQSVKAGREYRVPHLAVGLLDS
jgi:hypothetical protein